MFASKKNLMSLMAVVSLGFMFQGCGRTSENNKVETKKGSSNATAGKPCTAESCPKVKFDVQGQGADGTTFIGYMGQPVSWSVGAFAADGSVRDVGIFISGLPKGATADKGFAAVPAVVWTPAAKGQSTSPIKVLVRDLSRCNAVGKTSKCSDPNASLDDFDQEMDFAWRVESAPAGSGGDTDAQIVRVSDLSCGGLQPTTNGQVITGVATTALPVLTGVLSGDMSGIIGILPNIIGTVSSGDEQKTPTQC
jgi:hypothetical protein